MKERSSGRPPRLALWLLEKAVYLDDREYAGGDFTELWADAVREQGPFRARLYLWLEVVRSLPGFVTNSIYWNGTMLNNYIKVALRNIRRQKGYSFINISGLAIGVASCLLILLWVFNELSYDRFHRNAASLYQVLNHGTFKNNSSNPAPLAEVLKADYPEVLRVTRYDGSADALVSRGEARYYESGVRYVDPEFLQMFSFDFLRGDPQTALGDVQSVVISQELAEKYFGDRNPIGETLRIDNRREYTVSSVIKPVPPNSSLQFDLLLRFDVKQLLVKETTGSEMGWGWYSPKIFVQLRDGASADDFNLKVKDVIRTHVENEDAVVSILPFTQRYPLFWNSMDQVYTFSAVALLVLVIAALNYINLATARSTDRAREVAMRKVVGAHRSHIMRQMLGESLVMALAAILLAVVLATLAMPTFNALTGVELSWSGLPIGQLVLTLLALALVIGVLAGSYPALLVSVYQPAVVLKRELKSGRKGIGLRRILVVTQFAVSVILIVGAAVVVKQVEYARSKSLGYDRDHLISIAFGGDSCKSYSALKTQLARDPRILNVSGSAAAPPFFDWTTRAVDWSGKDPEVEIQVAFNIVDYDFVETLGIELAEGRSFSRDFASDANSTYLINESLARLIGEGTRPGAELAVWDQPGEVIGVMKGFHFTSLHNPITPLVFVLNPDQVRTATVRVAPEDVPATIAFIEKTWNEIIPAYPFDYGFVDAELDAAYRKNEKAARIVGAFAGLAVFVACLGLMGLASSAAQSRSKEIAIRKVLGAAVPRVFMTLSLELIGCVLVANVVAWPVAYLWARRWLNEFTYRVDIGLSVFALAFALTLVALAVATGYQTYRAARSNPVDRLKYE